jgi:glycosyltransferase involved in cell wall biosynthesis
MKICFVLEHFYPHIGGAEVMFAELAKRLALSGHDVRVVTSDSGGIVGVRDIYGIQTYYIRSTDFFGHPIIPKSAVREHVRWADIVHTTTYTAAPTAYALSKRYGKPCVITVHEAIREKWFLIESNPVKALLFLAFEWFVINKKYAAFHAVSRATERDLLEYGIASDRITMVHLGIDRSIWKHDVKASDTSRYFDSNPDDHVFLYTGRPGKPKGINVLLRAIREIDSVLDHSFVFAFILSKNPPAGRKTFEKNVKRFGLQQRIRITDSIPYDELPGIRKAAFAVIVPSLTEGFGFSAAETAAIGTPIISSDAGSLPEVLGGKVLFFKSGNPVDLSRVILQAARGSFTTFPEKTFSWDDTSIGIRQLYEKAMKSVPH